MKLVKYPKIPDITNPVVEGIFEDEVEVTEKLDGSQFRAILTEQCFDVGSKSVTGIKEINPNFASAIEQIRKIHENGKWKQLGNEVILFCEYMQKNKQNTITYKTIPKNHLYLFGVIIDNEHQQTDKIIEIAKLLDIESPNVIHAGKINKQDIKQFLQQESKFGNVLVEGVVIKNYHKTYPLDSRYSYYYGFPLATKYVREDFKEHNKKEWKKVNGNIVDIVSDMFLNKNRLMKAIQHLKEEGKIYHEKADLKYLPKEFYNDLLDEEYEEISKIVMKHFLKQFKRKCNRFVVSEYLKYLKEGEL